MVQNIAQVGGIQTFVSKEKWEKWSIFLFISTYPHRLEYPVLTNIQYMYIYLNLFRKNIT